MREIVSPLAGIRSPFGRLLSSTAVIDPYAVASFSPDLVFGFEQEYYRTGGTTTTFDSAMTHSRSGNATMVDSDGLLKWAPHNLALNSATPATQIITVVSGADYTVECTGVSIALSGAGTGTVTEGNPVEITASTTTLTLTVIGSTGTMWAYRSDLGGMVNNPDTGNSYAPTTSAARYLPRRGHHIYNGAEWVNEGVLVESEARTNLVTYSEDLSNAIWVARDFAKVGVASGPMGTTAYEFVEDGSSTNPAIYYNANVTDGTPRTFGVWLKASAPATMALSTQGSVKSTDISVTTEWQFYWVSDSVNAVIGPHIGGFGTLSVGSGLRLWVALPQQEAGSTPSSYIPTFGATATRTADDADSDNLTYDSSAMWFTLSGLQTFADEGVAGQEVLFDWRADANNRITVTIDTDGAETGEITLTVVSGGTTWSVAQDYLSPGINVPFNVAWRVTDTEINVAAGGTSATAVATTSIPDLSSASAAFDGNGVYSLFRQGVGDIGDSGIAEASE